jgi:hypothetical protein
LITPAEAVAASEQGLDTIRFDRNSGVHPGTPLFVTRLDVPSADYYLVPWENDRGIVAVVQIDAATGAFASAAAFPAPQSRLVPDFHEALRTAAEEIGTATEEPRLVWQPSRESASPLQPLVHVRSAAGERFVGWNGVHASLTPFGRGG